MSNFVNSHWSLYGSVPGRDCTRYVWAYEEGGSGRTVYSFGTADEAPSGRGGYYNLAAMLHLKGLDIAHLVPEDVSHGNGEGRIEVEIRMG